MIEGCFNPGDHQLAELPELLAACTENCFERNDSDTGIRAGDALQQDASASDVMPLECGASYGV